MIHGPKSYSGYFNREGNDRAHNLNATAQRISEIIKHSSNTPGLVELQPISPNAHHVQIEQPVGLGRPVAVAVRHELSV